MPCLIQGCKKRPTYKVSLDKPFQYCSDHKTKDMIIKKINRSNVQQKIVPKHQHLIILVKQKPNIAKNIKLPIWLM